MDEKELIKKTIQETVAKDTELTEEQKAAQTTVLERLFVEGMLPQKALELSDEMMEFIYGQAYHLFDTGHFGTAATYFFLLNDLNPNDLRYLNGYAACKWKLDELEEAIEAYHIVSLRDPLSPFIPYYLGCLYEKINKFNAAYAYYSLTTTRCEDNPELKELKERAQLNLEALEKKGVLAT